MSEEASGRVRRLFGIGFGTADFASSVLIYIGVFQGLPARWWPVDVAGAIVIVLFAVAGTGLIGQASWAPKIAWVAAVVSLTLGVMLVATLALTAAFLSGIYGPVGRGGALILALTAALALPYLIVLPAAQLLWLGPLWRAGSAARLAQVETVSSGS